ncbi:MAG: hypothetical protein A2Z04_00430 [Chloroflexi bacterium RBG_16_57_9]|nr:MAG: hypothetical protein A2Z04_00430 [Chloroflexi bacterium RBG_16_57_9]
MFKHQVLVIGGGLAGLRAAVESADSLDTAVLSLLYPIRSHSGAAQGGMNAALANADPDDSPERHAYDTVKGSDFLADQDASLAMTMDAPARIYELDHWGCPWSRMPDGRIAQRPFGGAGYPRTCFGADRTGHYILQTVNEQSVKRGVKVYNEWAALSLIVYNGVCKGVVAMNMHTGDVEAFYADATIMATGGLGRIYARTSNAMVCTGYGMAIAFWAGVPLKDMEFIQFHPTSMVGTNILVSEAARGEGGYLINNQGERFMTHYVSESVMELAPRDIVSRSIQTEINEGRGIDGGVYLDLRHLGREKILERLPGIRELAMNFQGVDPIHEPIRVQPGQHYAMGGIDTDKDGASRLPGFYAAGECACVNVHGANRLGGNSLLETVVFGKRAGEAATRYVSGLNGRPNPEVAVAEALQATRGRVDTMLKSEGKERMAQIRDEMAITMSDKVGVFRQPDLLVDAVETIRRLKDRYENIGLDHKGRRFNLDLLRTLELGGMLDLAETIAVGAMNRTESRGSHARRDFTKRDDENWLKHTLATWTPDGPKLSYSTVTITKWQPEERKY